MFISSLILLSTYCVPDTGLGVEDLLMNRTDTALPLMGFGREIGMKPVITNDKIITKKLQPLEKPRTLRLMCTTGAEK